MNISKLSVDKLARKAGIETISGECHDTIQEIIAKKLEDITRLVKITNSQGSTKTIMPEDVYTAFRISGNNIAKTTELQPY